MAVVLTALSLFFALSGGGVTQPASPVLFWLLGTSLAIDLVLLGLVVHRIVRVVRAQNEAAPGAKPIIDDTNNLILTGELYKALKETRKLIAHEKEHLKMRHAVNAYAKATVETASPRALEANLLLQAAAKLQAVHDSWPSKSRDLDEALLYNRRLWTVFLDAVTNDSNKLPNDTRENIRRLGVYVMAETFSMMTKPKPDHLKSIIKINRGLAAGLRAKA